MLSNYLLASDWNILEIFLIGSYVQYFVRLWSSWIFDQHKTHTFCKGRPTLTHTPGKIASKWFINLCYRNIYPHVPMLNLYHKCGHLGFFNRRRHTSDHSMIIHVQLLVSEDFFYRPHIDPMLKLCNAMSVIFEFQ